MLVIKIKLEKKRYEDALMDVALAVLLGVLFAGSYSGMVVAMVASLVISIYFLFSPPTFFGGIIKKVKEEIDEINGNPATADKKAEKKPTKGFDI